MIFLLTSVIDAVALSPDFYANSSVLANGKWAKVLVKETGMQFISNATIRALGFNEPEKVNVFGYGGHVLPEKLDTVTPDDLPLLTSLHTPTGIIFFGLSSVKWENSDNGFQRFRHLANPYSDNSYYFLSDIDVTRPIAKPRSDGQPLSEDFITTFTERLVHEQDILAPASTGRLILGEDFRSQSSRTFTFQLPDNTGDAKLNICFGAKVTGGSSNLTVTANENRLPTLDSEHIPSVSSSETFLNLKSIYKTVETPGDLLNLTLTYSYSGMPHTAALDYIEVEYERELRLRNDELYFYLSTPQASAVKLEGCNEATLLWDVTDPLHPLSVPLKLEGSAAIFTTPSGNREYVAFNPNKVPGSVSGAGAVANQNLHAMEPPGMLIISPEIFRAQAQRLADLHAQTDGIKVVVLTPEEIYNEFSSGKADVTAFRRLLKMWFDRAEGRPEEYTKFCLLFSRPTYDNKISTPAVKRAGYPRIPIWQEPKALNEGGSYSTDDYIGMLEDQTETLNLGNARIHVAVGRMPVKSVAEAENAIQKLEKYLLSPNIGSWRNNVMVIADDQDNAVHLDQAEKVIEAMCKSEYGTHLVYEKLYLDAWPLGHSGQGTVYTEAKQRMMDKINEGVSLVNYIGHASPRSWGHENLLTWTDISTLSNKNLPFIYAATCEFLYWDADDISGGEEMWLAPESGIIGMICPSRKVLISLNGQLNEKTAGWFYAKDRHGHPLSLGEIMINGKNECPGETNKLRYAFLGDPSMKLPYPVYNVVTEEINGISTDSDDFPELKAKSKVTLSGRIMDSEGNTVTDFNGLLDIQLYDAEKVVETYGNGADGDIRTYNDRKTRLYIGKTTVKNGLWETAFVMPSEIENNYSPALISLYGHNSNGEEANGSTDRFYVYGYEATKDEDFDGPSISNFYLNLPTFKSGETVGPSPVLYATLYDPSGINLSEAGIGHKLTISIDGTKHYDDANLYYSQDCETFEKGTLKYPLKDIEPGEHTVTLTAWDNANNSSSATLGFCVKADWQPSISNLTTDVNPATTSVVFTVDVDEAPGNSPCVIEVFDLGGKMVWRGTSNGFSDNTNSFSQRWNLRDNTGRRVPRGLYLYRATIITDKGQTLTKTRKLAVAQ